MAFTPALEHGAVVEVQGGAAADLNGKVGLAQRTEEGSWAVAINGSGAATPAEARQDPHASHPLAPPR